MRGAIGTAIAGTLAVTAALSLGGGSRAAQRPPSHIYVVDVPTRKATQLTDASADDYAPALSPDGARIAFLRGERLSGNGTVWVMRSDGSGERLLTPIQNADGPLVWSPDGLTLLFAVWDYSGCVPFGTRCAFTNVWSAEVATGAARMLLPHAQNPSWSPDGRAILYQDFQPGIATSMLLVATPSGATPRVVSRAILGDARQAPPVWTPSGRSILFGAGVRQRLFVVGRSGGRARRLTHGMSPAWSPDGREVAVVRSDGIWKVVVRRRAARRLLHSRVLTVRDAAIAWAPDGSRIAVLERRALLVIGRRDRRVTKVAARAVCCFGSYPERPAWSRNGRRLVYAG